MRISAALRPQLAVSVLHAGQSLRVYARREWGQTNGHKADSRGLTLNAASVYTVKACSQHMN